MRKLTGKNKARVLLAVIIFSGVFICGIGVGVGFLEFSSYTYVGTRDIAGADIQSATLEYTAAPNEELTVVAASGRALPVIREDQSVPENIIRVKVDYNAKAVEPRLSVYDGYLNVEYFRFDGGFQNLIACKDQLLDGLRNREIATYEAVRLVSVEVLVNPATTAVLRTE